MRKKVRTFLTFLGVMVGISGMLAVMGTVETTDHLLRQQAKQTFGYADYLVHSADHELSEYLLPKVKEVDGVSSVLGILTKQATVDWPGSDREHVISLSGINYLQSNLADLKVLEGDLKRGLILSKSTASYWKLNPGDPITLTMDGQSYSLPVGAIVKDTPLLEEPRSGKKGENRYWKGVIPLSLLQKWGGMEGKVQEIRINKESKVRDSLFEKELGELLQSHEKSAYLQSAVIDTRQNSRLDDFYITIVLFGVITLGISSYILFNTFYISISERKQEFAVMKTFGFTPGQVRLSVLRESLLLAISGTLASLVPGIWLTRLLISIIFYVFQIETDYELKLTYAIPTAILLGLFMAVFASMIPVYQASRTSVVGVIRPDEKLPRLGIWRVVTGILLILSSWFNYMFTYVLLFVGVYLLLPYGLKGIQFLSGWMYRRSYQLEETIALRNVTRVMRRSVNMAVILAFGFSLFVLILAISYQLEDKVKGDVEDTFGGDIQVSLENFIGSEEKKKLETIDGVIGVEELKEAPTYWSTKNDSGRFHVWGVGIQWMRSHPLFQPLGNQSLEQVTEKLKEPGTVILGDYAFNEWGGKVGDQILLTTPVGEKSLKVVGVAETTYDSGYTAFINTHYFEKYFGAKRTNQALLSLKDKEEGKTVRTSLYREFGEQLMRVQTVEQEVEYRKRIFPSVSVLYGGLLLIVGLTSAIGLSNLLFMNVMERTREIALMRAVGCSRMQIGRMIWGEGIMIGMTGTLVGVGLGIWMFYLASQTPNSGISFTLPWMGLIGTTLIGILVSFLAILLPSYRGSQISLKDARS